MRDIEHARMMLKLARDDLATFEILVNSSESPVASLGFHAQQAVEKALKSWLSLIGMNYPPTHNLRTLFDLLEDQGVADAAGFHDLAILTPFAVQFRYGAFQDSGEDFSFEGIAAKLTKLLRHIGKLIGEIGPD